MPTFIVGLQTGAVIQIKGMQQTPAPAAPPLPIGAPPTLVHHVVADAEFNNPNFVRQDRVPMLYNTVTNTFVTGGPAPPIPPGT